MGRCPADVHRRHLGSLALVVSSRGNGILVALGRSHPAGRDLVVNRPDPGSLPHNPVAGIRPQNSSATCRDELDSHLLLERARRHRHRDRVELTGTLRRTDEHGQT